MNCVVLLMRLMLVRMESIWSWFAWISSKVAPCCQRFCCMASIAAAVSACFLLRPSAVFRTLPARVELSTA